MKRRSVGRLYWVKFLLMMAGVIVVSAYTIRFIAYSLPGASGLTGLGVVGASGESRPAAAPTREPATVAMPRPGAQPGLVDQPVQVSPSREAGRPVEAVRRPVPRPQPLRGLRADAPDPIERERARGEKFVAVEQWDSAVAVYRGLHATAPGDSAISLRYARLLAWSGSYDSAARAMSPLVRAYPQPELLLEQARYWWWGGDLIAADASLGEILRIQRGDTAALALRAQIRAGSEPSVELAQRWVEESGGAIEQLLLARAYVRAQNPGAALSHFRHALERAPVSDSLFLEYASAATAADSLSTATLALERYLARVPGDRSVRVQLATLYSTQNRNGEAINLLGALLREQEDPDLRLARGQLHAWSGNALAARTDLNAVTGVEGVRGPALKLLGDLARWDQDWRSADLYYARARSEAPTTPGLAESMASLATARRAAREALLPRMARWHTAFNTFGDTEGLRWLSMQVTGAWTDPSGVGASLTVRQNRAANDGSVTSPWVSGPALAGAELALHIPFTAGRLRLNGGMEEAGSRTLATWGLGVNLAPWDGTLLTAGYNRTPARYSAGTLAAWQDDSHVDRVQLDASYAVDQWRTSSNGVYERFGSSMGDGERLSGSLAIERSLPGPWSAALRVSALGTSNQSPTVSGTGRLYWAPTLYLAPAATLGYATRQAGVDARFRLAPGVAYVRERADSTRRYASSIFPFLGLGVELSTRRRAWELSASGDWNGAAGELYRAGGMQLQIGYYPE